VVWARADRESLYFAALQFEERTGTAFPREVAAFFTLANGCLIDDSAFLSVEAPVCDRDDDGTALNEYASFGALFDAMLFGERS
jgi:hypothetical protein